MPIFSHRPTHLALGLGFMLPSHNSMRRDRQGVAAVELAVLLPFLCFAFLVTVDFCRVFYISQTLSTCARNGAIYGSADVIRAQDGAGITAAAKADGQFNLDGQLLRVASSSDSSVTYVEVTASYPFTTLTNYPGIPRRMDLHRSVRMNVVPAIPKFR